jgi:hypothetical protein
MRPAFPLILQALSKIAPLPAKPVLSAPCSTVGAFRRKRN